jgi:hypothetical protein
VTSREAVLLLADKPVLLDIRSLGLLKYKVAGGNLFLRV